MSQSVPEHDNDTVLITDLSVNGEGVGRLSSGEVVFVPNTLPGDQVRIDDVSNNKRLRTALRYQVIQPSSHRVPTPCQEPLCGGCALQEFSLEQQRLHKLSKVVETFRRLANMEVASLLTTLSASPGDGWHYRHRIRLHALFQEQSGWTFGYRQRSSQLVVPFRQCPTLWPELELLAQTAIMQLHSLPQEVQLQELRLAFSRRDGRGAGQLIFNGDGQSLRQRLDLLAVPMFAGLEMKSSQVRLRTGHLQLRYDHAKADDFDLWASPDVFTQANPSVNDLLIADMLLYLRPSAGFKVVELHAGIGNFSLPLARAGASVRSFERQPAAVHLAQRNGQNLALDWMATVADDVTALSQVGWADVLILDPPRIGARAVVEFVQQVKIPQILYISCDPATLARDSAFLVAGGYQLDVLRAYDMFPHTPHVELFALFSSPFRQKR